MSDNPTTPQPGATPDEPVDAVPPPPATAAPEGPVSFAEASPTAAAAADAPTAVPHSAEAAAAVEQQVAEAQPAGYEAPAIQPRGPEPQQPAEPGWWQASDGWWYPPESATAAPATQPQYAEPTAAYAQPAYADPNAGAYPAVAPAAYPAAYAGQPGAVPKSRVTAGILGILLGGFGVHRFYLGYTNIGIIQIVVTVLTCGLGSLWGIIEGILILVKNQSFLTDAKGVPLAD